MSFSRTLSIVMLLAAACGCTVINMGDAITSQSLLQAAKASDDSVRLEIYWADLPAKDGGDNDGGELWASIEETGLPPELRRNLAGNGLRAGVVGGTLPDELLALLNPKNETAAPEPEESESGVISLDETGVSRATYTLRPGRRVDVQAGAVVDSAAVLVPHEGRLTGETYNLIQPTYTLEVLESDGQGARLRLSPELRHGEQRLRFTPDTTGVISRASMTRDVEAFPELAILATLTAGETLVVTSTPNAGGRIGGYFHRPADDPDRRRAMLIRVAAAPREPAFDAE